MNTYEINGTYGSNQTPCTVLVAEDFDTGAKWYCAEDSVNVNATYDDMPEGVDIELLSDSDCFTWVHPIETLEELEIAVES